MILIASLCRIHVTILQNVDRRSTQASPISQSELRYDNVNKFNTDFLSPNNLSHAIQMHFSVARAISLSQHVAIDSKRHRNFLPVGTRKAQEIK